MQWFQDPANQASFQLRARQARNGQRRVHNRRLVTRGDMPREAPRLQATPVGRALAWWRHLSSGFYTISEGLSIADADSGTRPRSAAILLISAASQRLGGGMSCTWKHTERTSCSLLPTLRLGT